MEIPIFKTSNGVTKKFLMEKYPLYYDLIMNYVKEENTSISERIYLYQNNMIERPLCNFCKKNKVKFIKFYKGYNTYCSRSCSASATNMDDSIKKRRLDGIKRCNEDKDIRDEMTKKSKLTKSMFSESKKTNINNKREKTNIKKYGVKNVSQNEIVKSKIKSNVSISIKKVFLEKSISNILESGFNIQNIDKDTYHIICNECNECISIKRYLFNSRKRFNITICTNCNPISNRSDFEEKVYQYIKSIYNGEIILNKMYEKKYELDIYLPDINLGIECNGLWWHSELYRDKYYHIDKLEFFKEKNINIINIWEDDWMHRLDIIKSRISYKLSLNNNKIYARKCKLQLVNKKDTYSFINDNHIQGYCISKYNIGLYYNNILVYIMTFGSLRKNIGHKSIADSYELLRSCSIKHHHIIGGFSKCLNFFIMNYNPKNIISYCDISFNTGMSYTKNGFTFVKKTSPNYYWFNKDYLFRLNRWRFRKDKLVSEGYDKNKTEIEIMKDNGYYRIWDCGSYLYEYHIDNKKTLL